MLRPWPTMCHSFCAATKGRSSSALPSTDSAMSKPAGCSSASSDAVSPACARRAAMRPDCPARPTWKDFVMVPKLATRPDGHRGRDRHGGRTAASIEAAQLGAGRGRRDRSKHGRRMPALAMQRRRFARQQLGPHFVARHIGRQHFGAARSAHFALGEDRRAPARRLDGRRATRRRSPARARQCH